MATRLYQDNANLVNSIVQIHLTIHENYSHQIQSMLIHRSCELYNHYFVENCFEKMKLFSKMDNLQFKDDIKDFIPINSKGLSDELQQLSSNTRS